MSGQLYRVGVTCISPHERCLMELILVASDNDDAKIRLPYVYDFSEWQSYRVDWTVKEPSRCVAIKTRFQRTPENEPDKSIERVDGSQGIFQAVKLKEGKKYDVKAATVLFAKSPEHARKKLAERINGGSEFVMFSIDEMAEASGFATAKDVSMFNRASFVRG